MPTSTPEFILTSRWKIYQKKYRKELHSLRFSETARGNNHRMDGRARNVYGRLTCSIKPQTSKKSTHLLRHATIESARISWCEHAIIGEIHILDSRKGPSTF